MPPFSPCGLAVDWVRSCHHGYWRFYPNQPGKLTGGQYYFLPAGAAHLKCAHYFGTSDWQKGDQRSPNQLGEVPGVEWAYRNGTLRGRIPPAISVGNCNDFGNDWSYPPNVGPRSNRCGIDSRCYTNVEAPFVDEVCLSKLDSPALQIVYCMLVKLLYDADDIKLRAFITCWFGPAAVLTIYPLEGLLPAMCIVQSVDVSLVVISGTDNFQQLALQALTTEAGPQDFGEYGTMELWHNTANVMFDRMRDCGVLGDEPLVLAGHSYGAAVCCVIAARVRLAHDRRHIYLFTFGKPRSGDERFRLILRTIPTVELANDNDIVTQLAPSGTELEPFRILIGPALFRRWNRWVNFTEQTVMDVQGNQRLIPPPSLAFNVLAPIIHNVLVGLPQPFVPGHTTEEYIRRLSFVAGPDECCVDVTCWSILFPVPFAPFGMAMGGAGHPVRIIHGGGGFRVGVIPGLIHPVGLGGIELGGGGGPIPGKGEGGIELGDQGELLPLEGEGGIELGGGGGPIPAKGEGGIELGDQGELLPLEGEGGIELGDQGDLVELEGEGGIELGTAPAPPAPGASCAAAGLIPFSTTVSGSVAVGITHDWWKFTSISGKTYTLTFTQVTNTPAANLQTGVCASLTIRQSFFFTSTAGYTESGATEPGYIEVFYPGFFGTANYSLFLTET